MRASLADSRRIVVKVGTTVVTNEGRLALGRLGGLVDQLAAANRQVVLVSSGAVGLGSERLGLEPRTVTDRQACAAAGQGALMAFYDQLARHAGLVTAQVLLTEDDFHHRRRYTNLSQALERLLEQGALPIINENDTVSAEALDPERRSIFGDNDRLAALVAGALGADLLVLLTGVDGCYTGPPGSPGAKRISVWEDDSVVFGAVSKGGTGGMQAKVTAAKVANRAGVPVVIADGFDPRVLERVLAGEDVGTCFPAGRGGSRRAMWLAFATAPRGVLRLNPGAAEAVLNRGASLLPVGVVEVAGEFDAGEVVALAAEEHIIAHGVCGRSSSETRELLGQRERGVLVHRDDLVLLESA
jgi:glutamate 5-kinase